MVDGGGEHPEERREREERLCLVGPGGRERVTFHRRSDGLWHYVVEVLAGEAHRDMGYTPGSWYPVEFSGLYGDPADARRGAAAGRAWAAEAAE